MRKRAALKRIASIWAITMVLSVLMFSAMSVTSYAAPKDGKADTIYFVIDGSEQTNRNFSISYSVQSDHELYNIIPVDKTGFNAEMDAKAGDTIVINYTVNYPLETEYDKYSNQSVTLRALSITHHDGGASSEEERLVDDTFSTSDGSTGTFEVEVPQNSDSMHLSIRSSYDFELVAAGTVQNSGTSKMFLKIHVNVSGGGFIEEEVEHEAEVEEGEDKGTDINSDIVAGNKPAPKEKDETYDKADEDSDIPGAVGVAVGGAAVAGAAGAAGAASGGGKKSKKKAENKKKNYRMYLSKDFGDAIKKGSSPVVVRAQIVEVGENGASKSRPDLTQRITVTGEGISIGNVTKGGMWLNAEIFADEQSRDNKGTVVFAFNGEGGVFRNRVVFRLVGQPYIVYPDTDLTSTEMVLKMMANDPAKYSVRFFFEDALDEPKKLLLSAGDRFNTATRAAENVRTYYADITAKSRIESADVFVDPEREYIGIHAEFKNGDVVDGGFYVEIWPEGLSVTSRHVKNDRLEIDTVANPEAGDLDYKIRPTDFEVRFAYRDKATGQPIFLTGEHLKPKFSELYEVDKYGNTFKGNFRFTIDTQFDLYAFEPQDTLPMLKEPYEAMIDIECEAGGETYTMPLPLSFYGEKPLLPSNAEWQAVYKKLKRAVQVFGVGADPDVRAMIREAKTMSAADLEYVRYWIILCGKLYYQNERREYAEIDKVMTNHIVVASALVKIGDKAVQVAIKLKWPNADSEIIAAFINPWKNALAEFIGQYVARFSLIDLAEGDPEEFDFIKTMLDSCESGLQEIFTSEEVMVEPKTGGKIVSLYMMVCFAKHYFYGEGGEKGDIFKSVIETFKDLTMAKLKAYFTDLLKKTGSLLGKATDFVGKHLSKVLGYVGYEKGLELSRLAAEHQMRMAIQNSGELSKTAYDAAKGFGEAVKNQYMESIGKQLSEAGTATVKWTAEYALAAIINYISKGTKKENEAYGVTTPEVLVELGVDRGEDLLKLLSEVIKERWDIDIMKYYIDAKKSVNDALDVSARLDGELLIMSFYGYTVEINIAENTEALLGLAYEICFGWMEDLWKSMQSNDPNWDPRDDLSDDTTMVDRMTERVKSLGSSVDITYQDK